MNDNTPFVHIEIRNKSFEKVLDLVIQIDSLEMWRYQTLVRNHVGNEFIEL